MTREPTLQALADIVPAPAPVLGTTGWLAAALAVLAAAGAAAATVWWWRRRRRGRPAAIAAPRAALERLRALRSAWEAREIGDREAAYRLAALLRLGLGQSQLSATPPAPAAADAALWREALRQLDRQRYAAAAVQPLPAALFDRAAQWLAAAEDVR